MIKSNNNKNNIFTNINYYNINNADKMVDSYQVTFYCHFLESKHNHSKVVFPKCLFFSVNHCDMPLMRPLSRCLTMGQNVKIRLLSLSRAFG